MDPKTFEKEKTHLQSVVKSIKAAKQALDKALQELGATNVSKLKDMRDDPSTDPADRMMFEQRLAEKNEAFNVPDKIKMMDEFSYLEREPFFARLDLATPLLTSAGDASSGSAEAETIYIGKFGYTDKHPVVTDWRAKVASIYYRYRYPQQNVKYTAPAGEVILDLALKRTYEVDNGELLKYYNNDIQLDENEIISDKISERTGGVLEDIVETIQVSQLDIIEADPRQICIVQGCVGSGKSTVAIHKLSHIIFNYPETVTPQRSILVAKSHVLVSYLATLFPKLGIFDIQYKTLTELVTNIVFREEMSLKLDLYKNEDLSAFDLSKVQELQQDIIELHESTEKTMEALLERDEYASFDSFVYSQETPIVENISEFIRELNEELKYQKERLKDNPNSTNAWLFNENIKNIRKLIKELQKVRKELKIKALPQLLKKWGIKSDTELGYLEVLVYLYIHHEIFGFAKSEKYQYCVVDEGQDLSVLEYLVLGKLVLNGRFCILGDLNQSYLDEGLSSWDEIEEVIVDARHAQTFELDTNYRSTKQIITLANQILAPYTETYLPKSIDRIGDAPKITQYTEINDMMLEFEADLTNDMESLDKSIGIIVFDPNLLGQTAEAVERVQTKFNIPAYQVIKLDEKSRISYIPKGVYLSLFEHCKGLEFAKVYVVGLNLSDVETFSQAKQAFVAVTRAMNEVAVYGQA